MGTKGTMSETQIRALEWLSGPTATFASWQPAHEKPKNWTHLYLYRHVPRKGGRNLKQSIKLSTKTVAWLNANKLWGAQGTGGDWSLNSKGRRWLKEATAPTYALPAPDACGYDDDAYPCRQRPKPQQCDHAGRGGFMGHTCMPPNETSQRERQRRKLKELPI